MDAEREHIADELARGYDGDAWHGSATALVLADLTAAQAAARPLPGAHSVWEIVLHMTGWTREVARRLQGGEPSLPEGGDWPQPPELTEESWRQARAALDAAHGELLQSLAAFRQERLSAAVGSPSRDLPLGTGVSYRVMLHGLAQHNAYHTGQIALLGKGARQA